MDAHRLGEERSLAYHAMIAARLDEDRAIVDRARARIARWRETGAMHPHYAEAWLRILDAPLSDVRSTLVDPTENARALRQSTPFAGELRPRERLAIHRGVGAELRSR